ncbi:MAG: hypothetical protein NTW32_08835 [Chloroflexi bacterium]|nr:hypothetical protein [Chloroflexota bacterium]
MARKPSQRIIPTQGGILQELSLRARLIFRLIADPRVSPWVKLVPIAGLIYWISPFDLIMGIPGIDAVDDVAILYFAQYMFIELCPPEVVLEISKNLAGSNNSVIDNVDSQDEEIVDGEATDITEKSER